jgi:hypothetical protein
MHDAYIISDYCLIRDHRVVLNGKEIFRETEASPAAFLTTLYHHINPSYAKFFKMDQLCRLGFLASELILGDSSKKENWNGDRMGLLFANAGSSVDTDRNHQKSINDRTQYFPSPSVFVYTLANIVIGEICIRHKIYGESLFMVDREFNAPVMHDMARQWLSDSVVDSCLLGWIEMDANHYDACLFCVRKKREGDALGIANFNAGIMNEIYHQGI